MVVGNGMMANAFAMRKNDEKHIIFASGISNSTETSREAFLREEHLLHPTIETYPDKIIVYFSTCGIYDSTLHNSPYIHHKLEMERLLRKHSQAFIIFRLPQVVGHTHSPTLINFLYHKIINQQPFELWSNSKRNLIDVQDVAKTVNYILDHQLFINQIVNLAAPYSNSVDEIIAILERLTQKRAVYQRLLKGGSYNIDLTQIQDIYRRLGINFGTNYTEDVIRKYYTQNEICTLNLSR